MELSDKSKRLFSLAVVVLSAIYGAAIFSGWHEIDGKWICGMPNFGSGVVAMVITLLLYARGIFVFAGRSKWEKLTLLILDILMISSIISLFMVYDSKGVANFFEQVSKSTLRVVLLAVVLTSLLTGARNIALLTTLIACLIMLFNSINLISGAYSIWGFIGLIAFFIAFFLQGAISFRKLSDELIGLYGRGSKVVGKAADEAQSLGNTAVSIATGRPVSISPETQNEQTKPLSYSEENNH